jgi:cell division protein FtsB
MPASSSAAAARRRAAAPAPRHRAPTLRLRAGAVRVRWDRLGRVALLVTFAVVAALYIQQGLSLLSTHSQATAQRALVQQLAKENRQLEAQQRSLRDPATIAQDARALGMVKPGERPYVIIGQTGH